MRSLWQRFLQRHASLHARFIVVLLNVDPGGWTIEKHRITHQGAAVSIWRSNGAYGMTLEPLTVKGIKPPDLNWFDRHLIWSNIVGRFKYDDPRPPAMVQRIQSALNAKKEKGE